jgi:NAD(P)-dependent dehydrogenase (short-subunit alcohol dehydrogenase family)
MSTPPPPPLGTAALPAGTYAGQTVLVTGGGTGIGRGIAIEFARLGASVAIVSRKQEHRDAGVAAVEAVGGRAFATAADIRYPDQISAAFDAIEGALGPVSVLVNNAAGNFAVSAEKMSPNAWRAVTQIVLDGTFFMSTEFARRRMACGGEGAVLNIAATYAWTGGPGASHSAAAKAGVVNLTQSLAVEWAPDAIRVNGIAPGIFPHGDQDAHWGDGREDAARVRAASVPAGRVGELRELGWAATFLCSPFARYITGHTLVVDGGNWLRHYGFATEAFTPTRDLIAAQTTAQQTAPQQAPKKETQ